VHTGPHLTGTHRYDDRLRGAVFDSRHLQGFIISHQLDSVLYKRRDIPTRRVSYLDEGGIDNQPGNLRDSSPTSLDVQWGGIWSGRRRLCLLGSVHWLDGDIIY